MLAVSLFGKVGSADGSRTRIVEIEGLLFYAN